MEETQQLFFDFSEKPNEYNIRLKECGRVFTTDLKIRNVAQVAEIYRDLKFSPKEKMYVVSLDENNKILGTELVSIGTNERTVAEIRDVFKTPLLLNAKNIFIFHNHPSGHPKPSKNDVLITEHLARVGKKLNIDLLYHIVIGSDSYIYISPDGDISTETKFEDIATEKKESVVSYTVEQSGMLATEYIKSPETAAQYAKEILDGREDSFCIFYLDATNGVISTKVYPKNFKEQDILKDSILSNARGVIIAKNFADDIKNINTLLGKDLHVQVLDQISIIDNKYYSQNFSTAWNSLGNSNEVAEELAKYAEYGELFTWASQQEEQEKKEEQKTNDVVLSASPQADIPSYQQGGGRKDAEGREILDEYYTPEIVVDKVWEIVNRYKDSKENPLNILEASVGVGGFFKDRVLHNNTIITAYEINSQAAQQAQNTINSIGVVGKVFNQHFEANFIDDRGNKKDFSSDYDLVIGNPPYGDHRGFYKGVGEQEYIKTYQEYFIKRGLDVLKDKGVLAMVVPSGFLRGKDNPAKREIAKLGTLKEAYRLPNDIFKGTGIGTDIVVIQKSVVEKDSKEYEDRLNMLQNNTYFELHKENVLGTESTRDGRFGIEPYVMGTFDNIMSLELKPIEQEKEQTIEPNQEKAVEKNIEITASPQVRKTAKKTDEITETNTKQGNIVAVRDNSDISEREMTLWKHTTIRGYIDKQFIDLHKEEYNDLLYYYNGNYYNEFNYAQGNIFEKIDNLKLSKNEMTQEDYDRHYKVLEKCLPKSLDIRELKLSVIDELTEQIHIDGSTLKSKFSEYLEYLPMEMFGNSSKYDVRDYINRQTVRGRDAIYNAKVRVARRETAEKLFLRFLNEELTTEQQKIVTETYTRNRRAVYKPDYSKVPLFLNVFENFKDKKLTLRACQVEGVGFAINKGAAGFAHDVGAGKTLTSILTVGEYMVRGWKKKPLIVVPNNVYEKWIYEIKEVLPDIKINRLYNLNAKVIEQLSKNGIEDNSISVMTGEGFTRLGFKEETYAELTNDLYDTISSNDLNKRQKAKLEEKAESLKGKAVKKTSNQVFFEDLGFDTIVLDEAHRYKNIFTSAKVEKGQSNEFSRVSSGTTSARGIKAFMATQYILQKSDGKGVILPSATPFTNHVMEYYSVLSLVARERLKSMGLKNVNDFMTAFMDIKATYVITADMKLKVKDEVERFKNAQDLRDLIGEYFDFVTGDDLGLVRPDKIQKKFFLRSSKLQDEYIQQAQELFKEDVDGGILVAITELQNITLSPYLSRYSTKTPTPKEFVENSPKISMALQAVKASLDINPNGRQIIYMPRGIEFHEHVKSYLVNEMGYKPDEIGIINGSTEKEKELIKIRDSFNDGNIRILIGSDTIKEGIDLQKNTTDIHILHLPWNPNDLHQVEGRAWRYGNGWKNVRINYHLIENSVDPFIFQKLEIKDKRIKDAQKMKSREEEVGDINFENLKLELITDPKIRKEAEKTVLNGEFDTKKMQLTAEIGVLKSQVDKVDLIKEKIEQTREQKIWISRYNEHYYDIAGEKKRLDNKLKKLEEDFKKAQEKMKDIDVEEVRQILAKKEQELEQIEIDREKALDDINKQSKVNKKMAPLTNTQVRMENTIDKYLADIKKESEQIKNKIPLNKENMLEEQQSIYGNKQQEITIDSNMILKKYELIAWKHKELEERLAEIKIVAKTLTDKEKTELNKFFTKPDMVLQVIEKDYFSIDKMISIGLYIETKDDKYIANFSDTTKQIVSNILKTETKSLERT